MSEKCIVISVLQRGSGDAVSLDTLALGYTASDTVDIVSKFKDSKFICSFLFPLLKLTQLLFLSSTPNSHLDLRGSFPLLMKVSCCTF